jgi:hypothetical protein
MQLPVLHSYSPEHVEPFSAAPGVMSSRSPIPFIATSRCHNNGNTKRNTCTPHPMYRVTRAVSGSSGSPPPIINHVQGYTRPSICCHATLAGGAALPRSLNTAQVSGSSSSPTCAFNPFRVLVPLTHLASQPNHSFAQTPRPTHQVSGSSGSPTSVMGDAIGKNTRAAGLLYTTAASS